MYNNELKTIDDVCAFLVIEEIIRNGVTYFCICSGARSTPLVVAIANACGRFQHINSIVCYDERGAAFHAMGYSKATQKISVVVTTSGTAIFHAFPALIEIKESNSTPIWVISADRPYELHQNQSNQTTNQNNIFQDIAFSENVPYPLDSISLPSLLANINQTFYKSKKYYFD